MSWSGYQFRLFYGHYGGLDTFQSPDLIAQGEGEEVLATPDCLNRYSWPTGAITKLFGNKAVNSSVVTSATTAITGLCYLGEVSTVLGAVSSDGKFWEDVVGVPTNRTGAITITTGQDNLVDYAVVANLAMFTDRSQDAPWKWAGAGNNIAALGGTPPSGKYCAAYKRRGWIFNTAANPNIGYYSALDNAESWDPTNQAVTFETLDGSVITAAKVSGESLYIGKEGPNANSGHLFRLYATGNNANPFIFEEIPTGGLGPVSQQGMIAVPNGDLIFPTKTGSFLLVRGNVAYDIGEKVRPYILDNFNKSRFQFISAGLLRERNLILFAMSTTSATTHDRVLMYDYANSVPGRLHIWWPTTLAVNCFTERVASGQQQLISGTYVGTYVRQLSGDSFDGAAFNFYHVTPWHNLGDPFTEKKIKAVYLLAQPTGYNFTFQYRTDFDLTWSAAQTLSSTAGASLPKAFPFVLGGPQSIELSGDVTVKARRIQFQFQNTAANQAINIYAYGVLHKPIRRALVLA